VASSPIALADSARMRPDLGKPCLNVRTQYTTYAAALLDDQSTLGRRLLCVLGTQLVGKGSFSENFNVKIFALLSTSSLVCGIIIEESRAWLGMLGVGVSRRQVGRPKMIGPCFEQGSFCLVFMNSGASVRDTYTIISSSLSGRACFSGPFLSRKT